jgi:hypothetical protein
VAAHETEPGLAECLRSAAADALAVAPRALRVEPLAAPAEVADATRKFAIRDEHGAALAFATCSVALAPDLVARACAGARVARARLGPETGSAVLLPLVEGRWQSLSWALLPWAEPLPRGRLRLAWARRRLGPSLLGWLREVTRETRHESPAAHHAAALAALAKLGGELGRAAERAGDRIAKGSVRPSCVLGHGDLWLGNILLGTRAGGASPARFLVIDWPGADADGFAIYDLLRLAGSLHASPRRLRTELRAHAELLDCSLDDTRVHLLAALGALAARLEHFPRERFDAMALAAWRRLEAALA